MADFSGKWNEEKDENQDEYAKQLGLGLIKRKMTEWFKQSKEIKMDDTGIKVIKQTPFGERVFVAPFGVKHEQHIESYGVKMNVIIDSEPDKFVINVTPITKGKPHRITHYMEGDYMIAMLNVRV